MSWWETLSIGTGVWVFFGLLLGFAGLVANMVVKKLEKNIPQLPKSRPLFLFPYANASERMMHLAAVAPQYTENVLRFFHGANAVDSLKKDLDGLKAAKDVEALKVKAAPAPITFRDGEPTSFAECTTHLPTVEALRVLVGNITHRVPAIRPQMLIGGGGRGKTTVVKLTAQEIRNRMRTMGLPAAHLVECFGTEFSTPEKLDAKVRLAASRAGSVLFIDEVHSMPREQRERMFMMLDRDWRYQYTDDDFPTKIAPFTVMAATTDRGLLDEPFLMRFMVHDLDPVPANELFRIALKQTFPVTPAAANLAVSRMHWDGSVRPLVNMLEFAHEIAMSQGRDEVDAADVEEYIRTQRIDEWGLRPSDRAVVAALAKSPKEVKGKTVHQLAEATLLAMAKVDPGAYRQNIRPRLIDRGFLQSQSTGQTLTDAGLKYAREHNLIAA